jgi:hypothetical protein
MLNKKSYIIEFALLVSFIISSPGHTCVEQDACYKDLQANCEEKFSSRAFKGVDITADYLQSCPQDADTGECDGECKYNQLINGKKTAKTGIVGYFPI